MLAKYTAEISEDKQNEENQWKTSEIHERTKKIKISFPLGNYCGFQGSKTGMVHDESFFTNCEVLKRFTNSSLHLLIILTYLNEVKKRVETRFIKGWAGDREGGKKRKVTAQRVFRGWKVTAKNTRGSLRRLPEVLHCNFPVTFL